MLYEPNDRYWQEFAATAETARADNVGLWGARGSFGAPHRQRHRPRPARRHGRGVRVRFELRPGLPDGVHPPPPPGLDCGQITDRRFEVLPLDPHRFDGNNDGVGCES